MTQCSVTFVFSSLCVPKVNNKLGEDRDLVLALCWICCAQHCGALKILLVNECIG